MPLLAICVGMQVLNVTLGCDLVQHLPDVPGSAPHRGGDAVFHARTVGVAPDSRLRSIVGEELDVHCYHHQAVGRLLVDVIDKYVQAQATGAIFARALDPSR